MNKSACATISLLALIAACNARPQGPTQSAPPAAPAATEINLRLGEAVEAGNGLKVTLVSITTPDDRPGGKVRFELDGAAHTSRYDYNDWNDPKRVEQLCWRGTDYRPRKGDSLVPIAVKPLPSGASGKDPCRAQFPNYNLEFPKLADSMAPDEPFRCATKDDCVKTWLDGECCEHHQFVYNKSFATRLDSHRKERCAKAECGYYFGPSWRGPVACHRGKCQLDRARAMEDGPMDFDL